MAIDRDSEHMQALLYNAYNTTNVRAMERPLLASGVPLMRMAASAVARTVLDVIEQRHVNNEELHIAVLAGAGDNGGDGLYAGAYLAARGIEVTVIATGRSLHEGGLQAFLQSGGRVLVLDPNANIPGSPAGFGAGEAGRRLQIAIDYARQATIVLDAMTGIGIQGALRGIPAAIASSLGLNGREPETLVLPDSQMAVAQPFVVAIDTPSGIGVDDGTLPDAYIPADITVMFGAMKPCAMLPPACYACGRTVLVDFNFDLDDVAPSVEMVTAGFASEAIRPCRVQDAKYSRGVLGLVTGSQEYPGAAVLSTTAAARSNIGMVRYVGPQNARTLVLQRLPEAVMGKGHVQAWTVGSGVPSDDGAHGEVDMQQQTISALLRHYALTGNDEADAAAHAMPPIVVDAGALDFLPEHVPQQVVITPHAGELARLLTRLGEPVTSQEVLAHPLHSAGLAARKTGATVLLKGAVTLIVGDDNGQQRVLAAGRAPACLATAGAGDVLAGLLGALLAQQEEQIRIDSACVPEIAASAAYIHGRAAAVASGSRQRGWVRPMLHAVEQLDTVVETVGHPIIASDVVDAIPQVFGDLE